MKKLYSFILFLSVVPFLFLASCSNDDSLKLDDSSKAKSTEHYVVILKQTNSDQIQSVNPSEAPIKRFLVHHNIDLDRVTYIYTKVVQGFAARLFPEEIQQLEQDPMVLLVEKDKLLGLDPIEVIPDSKNKNIPKPQASTQTTPWGVTAVGGFVNAQNSSRMAWIIDTGIDLDHPDLNVNVSLSKTFVRTGIDSATPDDYHGHGTHVAGIIAAKNNDFGVVGIAAGAKVVAIKVLSSSGWGWDSDIIAGLDYVTKRGNAGDVVNMSLGGEATQSLDYAVMNCANYGFLMVLAAGNSSIDASNFSPARANGRNIYTVSAHNSSNSFAWFSNFGNPPIDYCAPGVSVYSTYKNGDYATMSGTSMAAPHVAGILLANNKIIFKRGYVANDPDRVPDPLASRVWR